MSNPLAITQAAGRTLALPLSTPIMYARCAWCKLIMGVKHAETAENAGKYSDGICPTCRANFK